MLVVTGDAASNARDQAVEVIDGARGSPIVIVCEHASAAIPEAYADLGLAARDRYSHAVWDPGAEALARALAQRHGATLVLGRVSRLVHDCNRPAASPEATPDRVERIVIPGNTGLSEASRQERAEAVYEPFHRAVTKALAADSASVLVTIHSFTPVWDGVSRATEIGLVHDADDRLARAMLRAAGPLPKTELNQPYSASDGVTHTLAVHAQACRAAVMIEVRSDLLADGPAVKQMAGTLAGMLNSALETEGVGA